MWMLLLSVFAAEPEPIPCCSSSTVQRNLTFYLRLQKALAADDFRQASGLMYGWTPVAENTRDPSLSKDDRAVLDEIAQQLKTIKNARTPRIREAFPEISKRMIYLVMRHPGGGTDLRIAHCPGVGPWIQKRGEILSPYDGCGVWSER